jgi:hypothetical protein
VDRKLLEVRELSSTGTRKTIFLFYFQVPNIRLVHGSFLSYFFVHKTESHLVPLDFGAPGLATELNADAGCVP